MFCIPSFDEMTDLTPYLNHVIPAYAGIQTVSHSANQVEGTSETGSLSENTDQFYYKQPQSSVHDEDHSRLAASHRHK